MSKKNKNGNRIQQLSQPRSWLYINLALAVGLILAGAAMLLWVGRPSGTTQAASLSPVFSQQQGQPAPGFSLVSPEGDRFDLSDYAGQVVLVNMWATWCPPCKAEMPAINSFYEAHREQGFTVLAVNSQEDARTVNAFIQAGGFSFPVLLDTKAEVMELYQVRGLPTSFIIDRDGAIRHVQTGAITEKQLEQIVLPLLAGS